MEERAREAGRNSRRQRSGSKTLSRMHANPLDDWRISDVQKVCRELGINCSPPSNGSHYMVSSEQLRGGLPIPARKPIRACYIRDFVKFAYSHIAAMAEGNDDE